jgi:hypothetical protein
VPHATYLPERMGTAVVAPLGEVEAGSYQSFTLVCTAGYFGIDDTGSIKVRTQPRVCAGLLLSLGEID